MIKEAEIIVRRSWTADEYSTVQCEEGMSAEEALSTAIGDDEWAITVGRLHPPVGNWWMYASFGKVIYD